MAANPAPTFADMLAADSDFVMPTTDKDVRAALDSFGADYKRTRGGTHEADRSELLAGLALLHTHHLDLKPLVGALTIAQHQALAKALKLDYASFGKDASWPVLLGRRIVAHQAPGLTPKKRRPARDGVDGQIRMPGAAGASDHDVSAAADQRPAKKAK